MIDREEKQTNIGGDTPTISKSRTYVMHSSTKLSK